MLQWWSKSIREKFFEKILLSIPKHLERNINLLETACLFFSWMLSSCLMLQNPFLQIKLAVSTVVALACAIIVRERFDQIRHFSILIFKRF